MSVKALKKITIIEDVTNILR